MKKPIKLAHPGTHRDVTGSIAETPDYAVVYIDEPFYECEPTDYGTRNDLYEKVIDPVVDELENAIRKHPLWPTDLLHSFAIVQEEVGETQKEVLQFVYETNEEGIQLKYEAIRKEAIQATAMLLRFLAHLQDVKS